VTGDEIVTTRLRAACLFWFAVGFTVAWALATVIGVGAC
jgi:hypothetical protein